MPGYTNSTSWSRTGITVFRYAFVFVNLLILTLSFSPQLLPDIPARIARLFIPLNKWVGEQLFHVDQGYTAEILSDSTGMYLHLFTIAVVAMVAMVLWSMFDKKSMQHAILFCWWRVFLSYYLAYHFIVYGFNKLFKWQFYLPEPNTLFTTVGNTYRDILYWSTMGTSHSYNVFLGSMELLAAFLLLFRRSRMAGAMVSIAVLVNIVMINFSFNISVKSFSLFLLLLAIVVLLPDLRPLVHFFSRKWNGVTRGPQLSFAWKYRKWIKTIIILGMFTSGLFIYLKSGIFNDDRAVRPLFHGAYDVTSFVKNGDTLAPLITDTSRWRRLFVHRHGYIIIQSMNDEMHDYLYVADTTNRKWILQDERNGDKFEFEYSYRNQQLVLTANGNTSFVILLTRLDLSALPAMQKEFDWTVEP